MPFNVFMHNRVIVYLKFAIVKNLVEYTRTAKGAFISCTFKC